MSWVFTNEDWDSIQGRVISMTIKKLYYATLTLSIKKVRIKDKVEESRELNSALPNFSVL